MLTTEQVKKIAEHLGVDIKEGPSEYVWTRAIHGTCYVYDPLEDADNHRVFKALGNECKKRNHMVKMCPLFGGSIVNGETGCMIIRVDFTNNESICLAYLAVMESK